MAELSLWTFRIKDSDGNLIANLNKAFDRKVKIGLNKAGEASFTYDLNELYNLATSINSTVKVLLGIGKHTLECLRGTEVVFSGLIVNFNYKVDETQALIEVKAMGWFWLLGLRFAGLTADKVYTDTDAGAIAWDLINESQSLTYGDMGFTQGTIQTSVNRSITYTRKSIKEAIEDMSGAENGFDFEITASKIFNIYYPQKGTNKPNVRFFYPGNVIKAIEEINDASELANSILVIGSGFGLQELSVQRDDTSAQSIYNVFQKIVPVKDLNNATVLGDIAEQELDVYSQVNAYYRLTIYDSAITSPCIADFELGDYVYLDVNEPYWENSRAFRVFEEHIRIGDDDLSEIDLVLGLI